MHGAPPTHPCGGPCRCCACGRASIRMAARRCEHIHIYPHCVRVHTHINTAVHAGAGNGKKAPAGAPTHIPCTCVCMCTRQCVGVRVGTSGCTHTFVHGAAPALMYVCACATCCTGTCIHVRMCEIGRYFIGDTQSNLSIRQRANHNLSNYYIYIYIYVYMQVCI